jgi:hypothetical protein
MIKKINSAADNREKERSISTFSIVKPKRVMTIAINII